MVFTPGEQPERGSQDHGAGRLAFQKPISPPTTSVKKPWFAQSYSLFSVFSFPLLAYLWQIAAPRGVNFKQFPFSVPPHEIFFSTG